MRVLQLGPVPPPVGGVSRNMLAIQDELRRRGHASSLIATTRGASTPEPDVYRPGNPFALARLLRTLDYDVLHLHVGGEISRKVQALCLACTAVGKAPAVLTIHSGAFPQSEQAKHAVKNSALGAILRRFDHVVAVSDPIAEVMKRLGMASENLSVISPFAMSINDERAILDRVVEEFVAANTPLLAAVGGLEEDYDPTFLLEAIEGITREYPKAGVVAVGDGSMRRAIEQKLASHPRRDRILLAGSLDHAATIEVMRRADVVLRTTRFDGDATSVREALALGTPVVATDTGGRPDGVHLMKIGDTAGLMKGLRSALAEGRRESKGEDGMENIHAVLKLYEDLIGR